MKRSFYEANARRRIAGLVDDGSFRELLPPAERATSPHLPLLDTPVAFDDGVVVGEATLNGRDVLIAAQEGGFMGGAVGEVHGAKLTGLFERAIDRVGAGAPVAVLLLLESGGVRLHEANAGLIAVSETMRALLDARAAGIVVIGLIGSSVGCFGGMGLIAACCDSLVMSEEGRLGMSGPEVIETKHGVEEFDSRDRALVWRTTGGKHRWLMGDIEGIVDDDIAAFRDAAALLLDHRRPLSFAGLLDEQALLASRIERFGALRDALDIWRALGVDDPAALPLLDRDAFVAATAMVDRSVATRNDDAPGRCDAADASLDALLDDLFPDGHDVGVDGHFVAGTGMVDESTICVVGTTGHAEIGVELALAMATEVLRTVRDHPGRAIVMLVDTQGQRLRHRDELLGINVYMAHLAQCMEVARRAGHRLVSLVHGRAVSGGYITGGMMADACFALASAEISVMNLPAMARVTKIPQARLEELAKTSPVFAPGADNYLRMGGLEAVWSDHAAAALAVALRITTTRVDGRSDGRRDLGRSRGGRMMADPVARRVRGDRLHRDAA